VGLCPGVKLGKEDAAWAAVGGAEEKHNRPATIGGEALDYAMLVGQSEIGGGGTPVDAVAGDAFGSAEVHYPKLPVKEQNKNAEGEHGYPENYVANEPDTFHNLFSGSVRKQAPR